MAYDIIGDIHGQADKLEALLRSMGYAKHAGAWRHPGRQAIFVGDFIDRGPDQLRTVSMVRAMVESGAALAVMGNHELNAIAWHTPDPENPGEYLRPHFSPKWGIKNRHQHERFLVEVEDQPKVHKDVIDWFQTLPLWIELPAIRVIHACWHPAFIAWLEPQLPNTKALGRDQLMLATREPDAGVEMDNGMPSMFKAVEALTKGIEVSLPAGHSFVDKDGIERNRVRVRWWDCEAVTYPKTAMLPDEIRARLPANPIPEHARLSPPTDKPIFFGHYWLTGVPVVQSDSAACLDYSAGKGGALVAYRWNGESRLSSANFVSAG